MKTRNMRSNAREALALLREQVERNITSGAWAPSMQLATERDLAKQFDVSRNTVRRLLNQLEAEGWIERHVGRGTFVTGIPARGNPANVDSLSVNPEEVMEARLLIEPLLARLVVLRASERELREMHDLVARGANSRSMADFEFWDNKLHKAIAAASKNQYLIRIVDGIHQDRQSAAWARLRRKGLTDDRRRQYQSDHEAIVQALADRDGEAARKAIEDHLGRVRLNLMLQ